MSDPRRRLVDALINKAAAAPVVCGSGRLSAPLSRDQARLWYVEQRTPGSAQHNIAFQIKLAAPPPRAAIADALRQLQSRHGALCLRVEMENGAPVQTIVRDPAIPLAWLDFSADDPIEAERRADAFADNQARRPFHLDEAPLYRVAVAILPQGQWRLVFVFHHIVVDGWSVGVLLEDFSALLAGREAPVPRAAFLDWAARKADETASPEAVRYWQEKLIDGPAAATPAAYDARGAGETAAGRLLSASFDAALSRQVAAAARRLGVSTYVFCLTAFKVLLRRLREPEDDAVMIGAPIAGRDHPAFDRVVGFFVRTVVLRTDVDLADSFSEIARSAARTVVEALENQPMPLDELAALTGRSGDEASPLIRTMFAWSDDLVSDFEWGGARRPAEDLDTGAAKFDMTLSMSHGPAGVRGVLEWSTAKLSEYTAHGILKAYLHILRAAARDPERTAADIQLTEGPVLEARRPEVLPASPPPRTLADGFWRWVQKAPEATAAINIDGTSYTYAQLAGRIAAVARALQERGVGPGAVVALVLQRSVDMVVAVHAAATAGCAYAPIDPAAPKARRDALIASAGATAIVAHGETADVAPTDALMLDQLAAGSAATPPLPPSRPGLAYLLHTSGSTGAPKPVAFPTDASQAFLDWLQAVVPIGPGDRVLLKTPYSFDVSVWELFWPLQRGAALVVSEPGGHLDPRYLADAIERRKVSVANFVPSLLEAFVDGAGTADLSSLRWILSAGETLTPALRDRVRRRLPGTLVNLYGPTECGAITVHVVDPEDYGPVVPIGRAAPHARIYLLDQGLRPVPEGAPGELCVGGALGAACGYRGMPGATADRFVPDPFAEAPGGRMYRTGDLARRLRSGDLELLGRMDRQVKLRGVRLEPAEIEAVLGVLPGVAACRAQVFGAAPDQKLVAFYVPVDKAALTASDLQAAAAAHLPQALVPNAYVSVVAIPTTANGKTDGRALERMWREVRAPACPAAPRPNDDDADAADDVARAAFEAVLGAPIAHPRTSFFELGGNSLQLIKLAAALEQRTGRAFGISDLARRSSLREVAASIRGDGDPSVHLVTPLAPLIGAPRLILLPPASGSALAYLPLAEALRGTLAVYGLAAPKPLPNNTADFVAALTPAAASLDDGMPTLLAGWSFGGILAYEMALAWARRGRPPAATILIDTWIPATTQSFDGEDAFAFLWRRGLVPDALAPRDADEVKAALAAAGAAFGAYRPTPGLLRDLHLIRARDGYPGASPAGYEPSRGWATAGPISVREAPGDHFALMRPPHVAGVAMVIGQIAANATGRGQGE